MASTYQGKERRRHRTYVTRNTEYHFRDDVCVAVRDRKSNAWLVSHLALQRKLTGGVRVLPNGTAIPVEQPPAIGEALYFGDEEGRELITSRLCTIERPEKRIVAGFPASGGLG
jgi:hypothetical protein